MANPTNSTITKKNTANIVKRFRAAFALYEQDMLALYNEARPKLRGKDRVYATALFNNRANGGCQRMRAETIINVCKVLNKVFNEHKYDWLAECGDAVANQEVHNSYARELADAIIDEHMGLDFEKDLRQIPYPHEVYNGKKGVVGRPRKKIIAVKPSLSIPSIEEAKAKQGDVDYTHTWRGVKYNSRIEPRAKIGCKDVVAYEKLCACGCGEPVVPPHDYTPQCYLNSLGLKQVRRGNQIWLGELGEKY